GRAAVIGEVHYYFVKSGEGTAALRVVDGDGDLRQPQLHVAKVRFNLRFVEGGLVDGGGLTEGGSANERRKNREGCEFHCVSYYRIALSCQNIFRAHFHVHVQLAI